MIVSVTSRRGGGGGVCWIMTQVKTTCRVFKSEEADRAYKMAVVPEGILCGVPAKSS